MKGRVREREKERGRKEKKGRKEDTDEKRPSLCTFTF